MVERRLNVSSGTNSRTTVAVQPYNRTTTASILQRARLPFRKNTTKKERQALTNLKKDYTRLVMKADKGNCFVVMDSSNYDEKMESLPNDEKTYELIFKPPFGKIEKET